MTDFVWLAREQALCRQGCREDPVGRALRTTERVWRGLQADDELEDAHRALGDLPARIERLVA